MGVRTRQRTKRASQSFQIESIRLRRAKASGAIIASAIATRANAEVSQRTTKRRRRARALRLQVHLQKTQDSVPGMRIVSHPLNSMPLIVEDEVLDWNAVHLTIPTSLSVSSLGTLGSLAPCTTNNGRRILSAWKLGDSARNRSASFSGWPISRCKM